jgi:hypothetical protein
MYSAAIKLPIGFKKTDIGRYVYRFGKTAFTPSGFGMLP